MIACQFNTDINIHGVHWAQIIMNSQFGLIACQQKMDRKAACKGFRALLPMGLRSSSLCQFSRRFKQRLLTCKHGLTKMLSWNCGRNYLAPLSLNTSCGSNGLLPGTKNSLDEMMIQQKSVTVTPSGTAKMCQCKEMGYTYTM